MEKRILKIASGFLVLGILYVIINICSIICFSYVDETAPTDAAIVLGAAVDEAGEPSAVFKARIDHAVMLYREGTVKKIIMTGGTGKGSAVPEAMAAEIYAVKNGIHKEDILTDDMSHYTLDNLENAKRIMDENGLDTALLVSDPLHMRRAVMQAEFSGLSAGSSPTKNSAYKSIGKKIKFLARETFYYVGYKWYLQIFGSHTAK